MDTPLPRAFVVFEKSHFELEYSFEDAQIKLKGENR